MLPRSRAIWRGITRLSLIPHILPPRHLSLLHCGFPSRSNPQVIFHNSYNHPTTRFASTRISKEALPLNLHLDKEHIRVLLKHVSDAWPPPPRIPHGWSCAWNNWDYFFSLFWRSPYFLRIPQIKMLVNIQYRIPGPVRPILYSPERETFIFEANGKYYLCGCTTLSLQEFKGVITEEDLVRGIEGGLEGMSMKEVEKDVEGCAVLQRILERDETIVDVLAAEYLDYTPLVTQPDEEMEDIRPNEDAAEEEEENKQVLEVLDTIKENYTGLGDINPSGAEVEENEDLKRLVKLKEEFKALEDSQMSGPESVGGGEGLGALEELKEELKELGDVGGARTQDEWGEGDEGTKKLLEDIRTGLKAWSEMNPSEMDLVDLEKRLQALKEVKVGDDGNEESKAQQALRVLEVIRQAVKPDHTQRPKTS